MRSRDYHGFAAHQRPPVDVQIGTEWLPGRLRSWIRRSGVWWAHVSYVLPSGEPHTATVVPGRVRSSDPRAQPPAATDDADHDESAR